jgi:hypothetical protein
MWLWLMNLVMFPSQTLHHKISLGKAHELTTISHLGDTKTPPFFLPKQFQKVLARITEVVFGYCLQHSFRKLNMSVLELIV